MHPVFWLRETDFSWISFFVFVYLFILPMLVNGFRLKASAVPCPGCMGGNKETQELITMLFLECQSSQAVHLLSVFLSLLYVSRIYQLQKRGPRSNGTTPSWQNWGICILTAIYRLLYCAPSRTHLPLALIANCSVRET